MAIALTATACGGSGSASSGSSTSATPSQSSAQSGSDSSSSGSAQTSFTSYTSTKSFDDTEAALKKAVASSGMMTLGDLNQAGALKSTGLNLKGAHTHFVGNPAKGRMFFQQDPAIGAVIPLGIYTWADNDGTAHVGYYDPAALFTAVNSKMADGGKQMAMAAKKIADGAAK